MLKNRVALPLVLAYTVTLAACSSADVPEEDLTSAAPSAAAPAPSPSATPSPSPSVSETHDSARPTEAPEQSLEAGTVADGTAASLSGEGAAEITFVREGDIAVVIDFSCTDCTGPTVLTAPDRMSPHDEAEGALEGMYLIDVMADSPPEQSLWLAAEGDWTIDLSSWNDLPATEGAVEGTGSAVMFFVDDSANSLVTFEPADSEDSFQGRYFGVSREDALMFGDTEAFSEEYDIQRPGVLAIKTRGTWSIEP